MSLFGDYVRSSNSIAQDQLQSQEGLLRGKAGAIRSDAAEQGNLLQSKFSDQMSENTSDFMKDVAIEQSIPGVLKLAQAGAQNLGGFTSRIAGAVQSGEDIAGNIAEKVAPSGRVQPSDDMEMKDLSPAEPEDHPATDIKPTTDDDLPQGSTTGYEEDPEEFVGKMGGKAGAEAGESGVGETSVDTGITEVGELGEEAGEAAAETLPEIAGGLGASVGEAIGAAIPVVGWIGSLAGLITGAVELSKTPEDPFGAISQKIQSANTQTAALESKVSSDEFQQRIGASMPSFGSLAAAGQRAQQGVALHD